MTVGVLVLDVRLAGCRSLKDKRHIVRSLIEKARNQFKVAVAEVGDQDLWGNAVICVSIPSVSVAHAGSVLQNVEKLFEQHPSLEIANVSQDFWQP